MVSGASADVKSMPQQAMPATRDQQLREKLLMERDEAYALREELVHNLAVVDRVISMAEGGLNAPQPDEVAPRMAQAIQRPEV